jgi:hypothetical protein
MGSLRSLHKKDMIVKPLKIQEKKLSAAESPGSVSTQGISGEDLCNGDVVCLDSSTGSFKRVRVDTPDLVIGIVISPGESRQGEIVRVLVSGTVSGFSNVNNAPIGSTFYVSDPPGQVSENQPTLAGHYVKPVGVKVSSDAMILTP